MVFCQLQARRQKFPIGAVFLSFIECAVRKDNSLDLLHAFIHIFFLFF